VGLELWLYFAINACILPSSHLWLHASRHLLQCFTGYATFGHCRFGATISSPPFERGPLGHWDYWMLKGLGATVCALDIWAHNCEWHLNKVNLHIIVGVTRKALLTQTGTCNSIAS